MLLSTLSVTVAADVVETRNEYEGRAWFITPMGALVLRHAVNVEDEHPSSVSPTGSVERLSWRGKSGGLGVGRIAEAPLRAAAASARLPCWSIMSETSRSWGVVGPQDASEWREEETEGHGLSKEAKEEEREPSWMMDLSLGAGQRGVDGKGCGRAVGEAGSSGATEARW
jgi:hypothetical protein